MNLEQQYLAHGDPLELIHLKPFTWGGNNRATGDKEIFLRDLPAEAHGPQEPADTVTWPQYTPDGVKGSKEQHREWRKRDGVVHSAAGGEFELRSVGWWDSYGES